MSERPTSLEYQPALDGVRALAVALVLCFHAGFGWMHGGYFGVSVFFTLSGFLITSLLLRESMATGRIDFGRFYARRVRRLLPASLLCLVAIVVAVLLGQFELVAGMRDQLFGALGQVYNWVRLAGDSSYGALFSKAPALTSPLEHYWSLAIEEQFYVIWPATVWLLVRWSRRRGRGPLRPLVVLTLLSAVVAPWIAHVFGSAAAYWATPARLGELLVGATAAAWLAGGGRVPARASLAAPVLAAAVVVLAVLLPAGSGPAYSGWMTPLALISAGLLLSLQVPGAVRSVLSQPPVVWLGKVSYGVYLYHWPVYVLLRQHGWRLTTVGGFLLAVSITLVVTAISYRLVEQPIRHASWVPGRTFGLTAAGLVMVLLAVAVVPVQRGFLETNDDVLADAAIDTGAPTETLARATTTITTAPATSAPATTDVVRPTTTVAATTTTAGPVTLALPPAPNRPVRILVVGDSTALYVGQGLAEWAVANPAYAQVDILWCQGCGFIVDGTITSFDGSSFVARSKEVMEQELAQRVQALHPDVVVLMSTVNDVADRQWSDGEGVLTPGDPVFQHRMTAAYQRVTDTLVGLQVPSVVWVVPPVPTQEWEDTEMRDPTRYATQHDVIRAVAAGSGPTVAVADLDDWLRRARHFDDNSWRPDGTHFTEDSARTLATDWFGPWIIARALGLPAP